jgi:uncharacterized protein
LLSAGAVRGLDVAAGANDEVSQLAAEHPESFVYFANARPDLPNASKVLEKYLKAGAAGIGELKFPVECDSVYIERIADVAREFRVPILFHFEYNRYNTGFDRFHKVLEKYPEVDFIGHAQTWWGNVDREHKQWTMHPKGPVTAGGITDLLLSKYPNVYGDLSAHSGLNALLRDEGHAREFLDRHQNQLLFGSDCDDRQGYGAACSGALCLAALRRLVTSHDAFGKIAFGNAARVLRLEARGAPIGA